MQCSAAQCIAVKCSAIQCIARCWLPRFATVGSVLQLDLEGQALWNLSSSAENIDCLKTVHKNVIWEMGQTNQLQKYKGKKRRRFAVLIMYFILCMGRSRHFGIQSPLSVCPPCSLLLLVLLVILVPILVVWADTLESSPPLCPPYSLLLEEACAGILLTATDAKRWSLKST